MNILLMTAYYAMERKLLIRQWNEEWNILDKMWKQKYDMKGKKRIINVTIILMKKSQKEEGQYERQCENENDDNDLVIDSDYYDYYD